MSFVGLHIHSDYSLLDGASQLPQLIKRALELKMPAIALTDHGVMYGAVELIKTCRDRNIKPIIGNEMYVMNGDITKQERRPKYHQVVLAKNSQGYKNLVKLTTISSLEGVQGKGIFSRPCINKDLLEQYREGLIVTSACLGGEVPQAILKKRPDAARKVAQWYKDTFGEDYYLEIQDHGTPEDRLVNVEIVNIAKELDIQIIATNDSHYISCNDVEAHDALLCIQTKKLVTEDKRLRYSGTEYLKSAEEMALLFRDHLEEETIQEAISNTLDVADKVQPYNIFGDTRIPNFPIPSGYTPDTYVEELSWEGLLERLNARTRAEIKPIYKERLEYELKMIQRMGFSTYFLVVWDYIKFARDRKIPVGPGRGSAAGSLVAYTLRITNIDPVHHGLLFERFLNPERKSMPDIDTDFCIDRRDEVIEYVTEKYGKDRVAQIITFNRMTSKAVLKDVGRVLDIPYKQADKMAKLIPVSRGKPEKLAVMISDKTPAPEFKEAYDSDPIVHRWVDMAIRIEGTNKSSGVHAAGVVISADPLDEIVPLQLNKEGAVTTQYSMEELESLGMLKMDFLGLKNLTMIQKTLDLVKKSKNLDIDPDRLPADERKAQEIYARSEEKKLPADIQKTYQLLSVGQLAGIFQLESSGMRQVVRDLKPSSIEDISSILSLYRPGPLDAGLIPKFINRKHGQEQVVYEHVLLEPILEETYAVMVYQEQIMKIAQDLAGYTLGEADLLRRAMGKKKLAEMQKHRDIFIDGAAKNGVSKKIAEELFDQMIKFAEYCFNKSHSMAYGYVTYQTAYLKANYPVEYMAALLTANSGNQDKVQKYIATCMNMNIQVEPPDINRSEIDFTPVDGKILFGLSAVRNLGQGAIECLLEAREAGAFESLADVCDRLDLQAVNKRAFEALIQCGAFDRLEPNRHQLMQDLGLVIDWAQTRARDKASGQGNLFDLMGDAQTASTEDGFEAIPKGKPVEDYDPLTKLRQEKELLGFYVSDHPLKPIQQSARLLAPVNLNDLSDRQESTLVSAIVMISGIKPILTKKGDRMAILHLEDLTGQAEGVVFPKSYERIYPCLLADARLIIWGKIDRRDDRTQLIIEDAEPIERVKMVMVELNPQEAKSIEVQHRLREIIQAHTDKEKLAKVPVVGIVTAGEKRQFVRFGVQFRVLDSARAVNALNFAQFPAREEPLARA
ncbi:DNA polymerase III subunit alpha [Oscillatoriales cyanobacterium LEGE 11467]|uniref:DNA polymerase III subunit alpha n=1 Tax=Zarconia navalis LEGE 11467 TaxID=1828826 RepID=A0A928Z5N7_9CYAN|nr:DNA polymerase III subunit alpha [Zarconia navalis]MBE9039502.1 DNA polymerase III subunit alpha [Zarconia navalis LEGE 11467]